MAGQQPSFIGGSSNFTISDGTFNAASGDFNQYYGTQRVAGGLNYGPTFIVNCPAPQGPFSVADLPHRNTHYTPGMGGYSNGSLCSSASNTGTHTISQETGWLRPTRRRVQDNTCMAPMVRHIETLFVLEK
jgi:hypothetical protein